MGQQTTTSEIEPFPTRPPAFGSGEQTLTGQVVAWSAANGGLPVLRSKEDTYRHVLTVAQSHMDTRQPTWRAFSCQVVAEYHEDVAGEPLGGDTPEGRVRARKLLNRLVAQHGALNALRLVADALSRGAGLGEGFEDDVLAVLKYAAAIGRGEQHDWRVAR
jgi:hypothetical protein